MTIELRGGLLVTQAALELALSLERAGHTLTAREGQLVVSQAGRLTDADRAQIRACRLHLLAIADYRAP